MSVSLPDRFTLEPLEPRTLLASVPAGFVDQTIVTGLNAPTSMVQAADGRIFVTEQGGNVRVVKDGQLLPTPFATVTTQFTGERGLLGIELDPDFESNGFVYVYYTATTPAIHNRVSRFVANGDVAVPGSEQVILDLENLSGATNHNGGAIHFGGDGKLYVAQGENSFGPNAQSLATRLGKILRINSDGTIPTDNPFFNTPGAQQSIFALGLRNPFTFAFQPGTGRMFINDVGLVAFEEINEGVAGGNYGWPNTEGPTSDPDEITPLYSYTHADGSCALTGGTFYNPDVPNFGDDFIGDYFFADLCGGYIQIYDPANDTVRDFATGISGPVDLDVSNDGALLYLARDNSLHAIRSTAGVSPVITGDPVSRRVAEGVPVTFSVAASGQDLQYQWQLNAVDVPGATSPTLTVNSPTLADNGGRYRVFAFNDFGNVMSDEVTLTVVTGQVPVATITAPREGALYVAGRRIGFAGSATDLDQRRFTRTAFTWQVDFHHDGLIDPVLAPTSGIQRGNFLIPNTGETSTNVFYRVTLTVTDETGLTNTVFRDVNPRLATLTIQGVPTGVSFQLDGSPATTPFSFTSVAGMKRTVEFDLMQTVDGIDYEFRRFGKIRRNLIELVTPSQDRTFSAVYVPSP